MKLPSTALALLPVLASACALPQGSDSHAPDTQAHRAAEPEHPGVHLPRGPAQPTAWMPTPSQLLPGGTDHPAPGRAHSRASAPDRVAPSVGLAAQLVTRQVSGLHFDDESSLRQVMRVIQAMTGINVHVEEAAEEAMLDEGNTITLDLDRSMTVSNALNLLTELAGDEVTWVVRHGVVLVTTPERAVGEPRTFVYDISDLLSRPRSFVARDINVSPSGGIFASDEDPIEPGPIVDEDLLIELIMNTIDPDSWDRGRNSITIRGGKLIVTHD